jgi:hypothetical protein
MKNEQQDDTRVDEGQPPTAANSPAGSTAADARVYPCADCGVLRSKAEGGTVFTVCDACWDKYWTSDKS